MAWRTFRIQQYGDGLNSLDTNIMKGRRVIIVIGMNIKKMLSIERFMLKHILQLKKRAYRWVHIPEEEAKRLEQDKEQPLLANVYHEFIKENQKFREYHIDTHTAFNKLEPKMSITCEPNARPLIII